MKVYLFRSPLARILTGVSLTWVLLLAVGCGELTQVKQNGGVRVTLTPMPPATPEPPREAEDSAAKPNTPRPAPTAVPAISDRSDANGTLAIMPISKQRSLSAFGHCVAHYLREVRYMPRKIPFGGGVVDITRDFDSEAQQWMAIGLCLEYAPRPKVDDISGKCIISAMRWYMREYPEAESIAPVVAAVSCLPAYELAER